MRLFVSYSRRDATAAGRLIADLEKASLSAWHDHELHGGDPWWQDILQQIRSCDVFVLALSDNVLASKPCMAELGYARALKLPIIPVQIAAVGNIRATPVADIQVLDYTARTVDAVLALMGAIYTSATERAPLPDPLPHPPAVPFEYLVRLGSAITAAELSPQEQSEFVHQLRECLETEDDAGVRDDAHELLSALRRRPDVTYRNAEQIDRLLAELGNSPAAKRALPVGHGLGLRGRHDGGAAAKRGPNAETTPPSTPRAGRLGLVLRIGIPALVLAVTALVLVAVVLRSPPSRETTATTGPETAASPGSSSTPTPTPSLTPVADVGVFSGQTDASGIGLSFVLEGGKASVYVCDGRTYEIWMNGTVDGDQVSMSGPGKSSLTGVVNQQALSGQISTPTGQLAFLAQAAPPPSGIYWAEIEINGSEAYVGWAVLPDGTQRGVINTGQGTSPAPPLTFDETIDPPSATFTLNGQDFQARAFQAGDEIPSPSPEASPTE
jgi:TIR domain